MQKKMCVVGGVAGGASFAARMRRLDESAQIHIFEKGSFISYANCGLPYHIGNVIKKRESLVLQTPQSFLSRFNIDVRLHSEVVGVDTAKNEITVASDQKIYTEKYDYLLLSPGCLAIRPEISGIDNPRILSLRTIGDMDRIKNYIDQNLVKNALVIGGGFIGLEMVENLRLRGLEVTLVELANQVFIPADPEMAQFLHQHLTLQGVELILNEGAQQFLDDGQNRVSVLLSSGRLLSKDLVILAVGVKPDTAFLKGSGVSLSERGAIIVDSSMRTNVKNVFAVGDAVVVKDFVTEKSVMVPLAGPANRQAKIAAEVISGIRSTYKHTQGTAICKVFDMTAAVTGINEKTALAQKIDYIKSYTHDMSHASYYPDAKPLSMKILFAPQSGLLLGAQIVGSDGVDKRIDVLATAVRHKLTIEDLCELELAYSPQYGSAKDPVNVAGFVGRNILSNLVKPFYAEEIQNLNLSKSTLLDVRTITEFDAGTIAGSIHIPIDALRQRMNELDKSKQILVFCQIGLRGYLASRILSQNGFTVKNLSGGYKTYLLAKPNNGVSSSFTNESKTSNSSQQSSDEVQKKTVLDACGLQCPGPIIQLKQALESASTDDLIEIQSTDMGFALDLPAWCKRTNNTLVSINSTEGTYTALVRKGVPGDALVMSPASNGSLQKTLVIFSNDFDRVMAAFIIANGAASMGSEVTLFFTFWGLNLLRKKSDTTISKSITEKMFSYMMPKGTKNLSMSKMNFAGFGTKMMNFEMKKKKAYSLEELMQFAQKNKIRFVACSMSMDIMGIKKEELIDGVEIGGVAYYLEKADASNFNMFI